jgi:hypothetical protein
MGCGDDTTGRTRVRFDVRARGVDTTFTTSRGWSVRVTEARVSLGPLRWYEGPPIFALRWWERALGVSVAHAHPGHYVPGAALADMLAPRVVDLTAGAVVLSAADGVTGPAQSAHMELQPPPAGGDTATVFVRGEATLASQRVRFRGSLALALNLEGVTAPATSTAPRGSCRSPWGAGSTAWTSPSSPRARPTRRWNSPPTRRPPTPSTAPRPTSGRTAS